MLKPASQYPVRNRLTIALGAAIALLVACHSSQVNDPTLSANNEGGLAAPVEITLAPGTYADITSANLRVIFDNVVSDSRCPLNVACIWAGSATIQFTMSRISDDRKLTPVTLATESGRDTATVYGQLLRLVRVDPTLTTTNPQPQSAYRATLKIGTPK